MQIDALLISSDAFFNSQCERFSALTSRYGVKAISLYREFPAAGGLMSYGTSIADLYRQAALYTGRILKGEKPADLPVQQATKVELIFNLKAAKALGVTFPLTLLGRANEVIEFSVDFLFASNIIRACASPLTERSVRDCGASYCWDM